jgi:glycosyltransferase involved in cell wall biosynthesis
MDIPLISVIICSYNRLKYIPGLLDSLERQTFDASKFEIVFVDNNSSDGTFEFCKAYSEKPDLKNFRYIFEEKPGLSHARNRGIAESRSELLVFLDDDALACPNYLEETLRLFSENHNMSCAGGKILPKYETARPAWMSHFLEPVMSVLDLGENIKEFSKNKFPIGANMMFRKRVFETIGMFNPELGRTGKKMLGGEEKDLFYRIRKADLSVYYLPSAWIFHIIPDERLTRDFIRKQALGIGLSENIRAAATGGFELTGSHFKELLKWGATIVLSMFYIIGLRFSKARMLIFFRLYVSFGLYFKKTP